MESFALTPASSAVLSLTVSFFEPIKCMENMLFATPFHSIVRHIGITCLVFQLVSSINATMILLYFVRTPPVNPSAMFLPRCTRYCHRSSSPVNSSSNIEPKWALQRAVYLDHILHTTSLDMYTSLPIVVPVRSAPGRKVSFARQLARRGRGGYDVWPTNYALMLWKTKSCHSSLKWP
jgi:hypothetical protein